MGRANGYSRKACAMIMLLDIALAVGYSSGRYNTSRLQTRST